MRVACHFEPASRRSTHLAHSMAAGAVANGDEAVLISNLLPEVHGDVCVAYGWAAPELFRAYSAAAKPYVYLDLGWWNRKPPNMILDGAHKVMVGCREPIDVEAYLKRPSPPDRFLATGIEPQPWRAEGSKVLLAGMSAKSAGTFAMAPEEWEVGTLDALRRVSWSLGGLEPPQMVYRPKPSWTGWSHLLGADLSPPTQPLEESLRDCWAVVAHHSNVAVDALIAGIPVSVVCGVCGPLSTPLARLWSPILNSPARRQLLADIAYLQWTGMEMRSGECWNHLKRETALCG